jgi:hypothetical protein
MHHRCFRNLACLLCSAIVLVVHTAGAVAQGAPDNEQANEKAVHEELTRVLARLAASAERTTMGGRMGNAGESLPDVVNLCRAARFLMTLPAAERYQLLKDWALPGGPGAMMRTAMCYAPVEFPPEVFFSDVKLPESNDTVARSGGVCPGSDGVICFVEMLVEAAVEAGKLPELAAAAEEAGKKSDMADTLLSLVSFARNRDSGLALQADQIIAPWQKYSSAADQAVLRPWPAYAVARAWMRGEVFCDQGERLAGLLATYAQNTHQAPLLSHVSRDRAVCRVKRCGGTLAAGTDPGLALWHPAGYYFSRGGQAGTWPGWWVERDGMIVHLTGPEVSPLYFDYPLVGTFEFSADAYCNASAEAAVQYGRILFEPFSSGDKTELWTIGQQASVVRPGPVGVHGRFNAMTIRVSPERISYLCNGVRILEDLEPSPTSPWLALLGRATRATAWCNLRMSGSPRVPRQVSLIQGDRMEGWMSPLYRESLPRPFVPGDSGESITPVPRPLSQDCDWSTTEGVLHGRCTGSARQGFTSQSWLVYHRPLHSGETLSYEFFYQPDEKMVYPCIGRIAMLVEPAGVRLHWVTDIPHVAIGGLRPDNAAAVADEQRGPKPLPLKPNDWNSLSIKVTDDRATFSLNGIEIYERRLGPTDNRMFGLFHFRSNTAVEVRNILLTGKWPDNLSAGELTQLASRTVVNGSVENERSRKALVDDSWFKLHAQPK